MLITCMFMNQHTLINMYETKKGILNIPNDPFIIYLAARGTAFPLLAGKESKEKIYKSWGKRPNPGASGAQPRENFGAPGASEHGNRPIPGDSWDIYL